MATVKYTLDPKNLPKLTPEQKRRLDAMDDDDIDYSDIPELGEEFFDRTSPNAWPEQKKQLTIRLDADVLDWLKSKGRGYQTRINYILRVAMETSKPGAGRSGGRAVKAARRSSARRYADKAGTKKARAKR